MKRICRWWLSYSFDAVAFAHRSTSGETHRSMRYTRCRLCNSVTSRQINASHQIYHRTCTWLHTPRSYPTGVGAGTSPFSQSLSTVSCSGHRCCGEIGSRSSHEKKSACSTFGADTSAATLNSSLMSVRRSMLMSAGDFQRNTANAWRDLGLTSLSRIR